MTLIKPTITESLFYNFFKLDPSRPMFYSNVYQVARNIFLNLGMEEKVTQMDALIWQELEYPFQSNFSSICASFYNHRFMFTQKAYTMIYDGTNYHKVTRFEMERRFEKVKVWVFDEIVELAGVVRFTKPAEIYS